MRALGWRVTVVELDPIPHPLQPPITTAAAQFAAIPGQTRVLADGLAFGTMPELVEAHADRLRFVPIVHMALASTPGLLPGEAGWLANLEWRALERAQRIVITGRRTLPILESLGARTDSIVFIPPGTDRVGEARAPSTKRSGGPVRLLCVANLTPGKGHDLLLRALARVGRAEWTLVCAGSLTRDLDYAGRLTTLARELGLDDRVRLAGELDAADLTDEYAHADLFVLATRSETYGMAVAEAIAHGLPVVSTATGEIPAIVAAAGLLADPGDEEGLATHLRSAIESPDVLERLARAARDAAAALPTWDEAAAKMAAVLAALE